MTDKPAEYPRAKATRVDPFHRAPNGPFTSLERESYAKARAKGETIKSASEAAGVSSQTGTAYEKHDAMRQRISELRAGAETFVGVSNAWIMSQLETNAKESRDAGAYKSSNEALMLMYKIMQENKSLVAEMARGLSHDVSPQQLQSELKQRFAPKQLPQRAQEYVVPVAAKDDEEEAAE